MRSFHWLASQVADIGTGAAQAAPVIGPADRAPIVPGFDLWDHWPIQEENGRVAAIAGGALVLLLSAPTAADPETRHARARIRLTHRSPDGWRDLGPLLPETLSPGSREWAGSAVVNAAHDRLTLYYTAAGSRGEGTPTFGQRILATSADMAITPRGASFANWTTPADCVRPDGTIYARDMTGGAAIGTIKAFRDPFFFRDPETGDDRLVFAASLAASRSAWNGAIGQAQRGPDGQWTLRPPLADADGLNNEMERPHLIARNDLYYLFWSTQRQTFADGAPSGPTGLYGAVAPSLAGPWAPLNETGLVIGNPAQAPAQSYSWLVLDTLEVWSFVDMPGLPRPPADTAEARAHFGGAPAPVLRLRLDGAVATIIV